MGRFPSLRRAALCVLTAALLSAVGSWVAPAHADPSPTCTADLDGDGQVGPGDLAAVAAGLGARGCPGGCPGDAEGDGDTDGTDLLALVRELGRTDCAPAPVSAGAPVDGYPSWPERTVLALTNAVRVAPREYAARYLPLSGYDGSRVLQAYPAAAPLAWSLDLNRSARAHSRDMAENGCWGHDSCDGTPWSQRLWSFAPWARALGENIAAGTVLTDPLDAVNGLLWDRGAADYTSGAGHRTNMMSPTFERLGAGFASGSGFYRNYWTQDFAAPAVPPPAGPPLLGGSHGLWSRGEVTFLATYHDPVTGRPPRRVAVVVDGTDYPMALDLGTPASGTYARTLPLADGCRTYHFLAVDAQGTPWRYPAPGAFRTFGEGGCPEDYGGEAGESLER
ncbi:MAG: hypothetical protein Kow0092_32120 [Deferrisomatales bacterium]